jgi:hypothetical protein
MALPAQVTGYDPSGQKWTVIAHTIDASRMGAALLLDRAVVPGMVVHVLVPLPLRLRTHGFGDQSFAVYAIVRRVEPARDGRRRVGLEFFGEQPPTGYTQKPWGRYVTRWTEGNRRRDSRAERSEPVGIEYLDEHMRPLGEATAMTENVSRGGARVCVRTAAPPAELVRVRCPSRSFESRAVVRYRYTGKDGRERLCLQFIDAQCHGWGVPHSS